MDKYVYNPYVDHYNNYINLDQITTITPLMSYYILFSYVLNPLMSYNILLQ